MTDSVMVGALGPGAIGCDPVTKGTEFPYVKLAGLSEGRSMEWRLSGEAAIRLGNALVLAGTQVQNKERAFAVDAPPTPPLPLDYAEDADDGE